MNSSGKETINTGNVIDFVLLKRVLEFARPYRFHFFIAALAAIALSVLGPMRPLLINYAIDNHIMIPDKQGLINITMLLITILVVEGVIQFFYIYLSTWLGQHVIQDIRSKIFKHIFSDLFYRLFGPNA
mgnify:CR=1 FL=1